jgi:hypothetical protein
MEQNWEALKTKMVFVGINQRIIEANGFMLSMLDSLRLN